MNNLVRLTINSPIMFRASGASLMVVTDQIHLPRLKFLETSKYVHPQRLGLSCPNLETVICMHYYTTGDAGLLLSRLGGKVKTLRLGVEYISDRLLQMLARITSLEEVRIETPPPHDIPYNPIHYGKLGRIQLKNATSRGKLET
ncbi:hypothetical protein EIP86_000643 [Pleurotus ostreatoroseus]|nr:hypothetical protein EIP86_000643 [Pleurotus ostreatoroseus]